MRLFSVLAFLLAGAKVLTPASLTSHATAKDPESVMPVRGGPAGRRLIMQRQATVRRMTAADVEAVVRVYAEVVDASYISFSELSEGKAETVGRLSARAPDIFREQLTALLHSRQHGFFVAAVGDELVGFALASLHLAEAGHTECWLDDIGVSREWQGQGIAKALASQVFAWGDEGNAAYYLLESGARKESAHHFFEGLGFRPLSIVFWRGGRDEQQ